MSFIHCDFSHLALVGSHGEDVVCLLRHIGQQRAEVNVHVRTLEQLAAHLTKAAHLVLERHGLVAQRLPSRLNVRTRCTRKGVAPGEERAKQQKTRLEVNLGSVSAAKNGVPVGCSLLPRTRAHVLRSGCPSPNTLDSRCSDGGGTCQKK